MRRDKKEENPVVHNKGNLRVGSCNSKEAFFIKGFYINFPTLRGLVLHADEELHKTNS